MLLRYARDDRNLTFAEDLSYILISHELIQHVTEPTNVAVILWPCSISSYVASDLRTHGQPGKSSRRGNESGDGDELGGMSTSNSYSFLSDFKKAISNAKTNFLEQKM